MLKHIVLNLLSNAIKFSTDNSKINIETIVGESEMTLVVRDEGIGIPEAAHSKIFGIFERGTSSSKYSGSGIGLAIVARAAQKMGGTCGVESELGKGSCFWLDLPPA